MDRKRIVQKRTTLLQKLAYISRPFVVYMVVKTAAMLTLMVLLQALPVSGLAVWVGAHSYPVSAVVNAVASLVGAGFLLNDFLKEATVMGEVDIDAGVLKQLWDFFRNMDCVLRRARGGVGVWAQCLAWRLDARGDWCGKVCDGEANSVFGAAWLGACFVWDCLAVCGGNRFSWDFV